ncbi:MAG: N-acetylmuramoyl-L-alanine amidase [Bacteroidota bacterium]
MALTIKNRSIVKNITVIFLLAAITLLGSSSDANLMEYKVRKVIIDAGHGGRDPGGLGSFAKEKDVALKVALKLGGYIEKYLDDVEVVYTRKSDHFVELDNRAEIANKNNADVFISIHANIAPWSSKVHGTETYVMGLDKTQKNLEVAKRENAVILLEENYEEKYEGFDPKSDESLILFELYQSAYRDNSLMLAANIEDQFKNRVGRKSRGVKEAPFWVLWRTSMPSVLVEVGFLSNPTEEKYLTDDHNQSLIASGIFRAFRDYKNQIESVNANSSKSSN